MLDYSSDGGNMINFRAQLINLRAQIKYLECPRSITTIIIYLSSHASVAKIILKFLG